MKELTKHIEALLLENDCVILPQFGGFVTNHAPARWVEDEHLFLPPYRTVGFNPQLKINDGLLVQSYMVTHDATYPEATRLVEAAIESMCECLYKSGVVELHGIGILHRNIEGDYHFIPAEGGVISPSFYGFSSLGMKTLDELAEVRLQENNQPSDMVDEEEISTPVIQNKNHTLTIKIRHEWLANAAAVAAAVVLFFLLSTPVGNTYIEEENYASLGSVNVFEQVKECSLITTLLETPKQKASVAEARPVAAKPVAKAETSKAEAPKKEAKAETSAESVPAPAKKESPAPVVKETQTSTPVVAEKKAATTPAPVKAETPVKAEKKEAPAPTPVKATPKAKTVTYNIIVASVGSEADAGQAISDFAEKGYPGAFLIKGNGRFRIAIAAFENEAEAYRKANEMKQNVIFKDAWVLKDRK